MHSNANPAMKIFLICFLCLVLTTSASSIVENSRDNSRGRAATTVEAPPRIINPTTLASPSTDTHHEQPRRQLSRFYSLAQVDPRILIVRKSLTKTITSPLQSPIIAHLNLLDQLLQTQFSVQDQEASSDKPLIAGHVAVLKARCRQLATELGPLHLKYRNCAFRYHELVRFLALLQKYHGRVNPSKRGVRSQHLKFCSALALAAKKLGSLVKRAINQVSAAEASQPAVNLSAETNSEAVSKALRPFRSELDELASVIETLDYNLVSFCDSDPNLNISITQVRESLSDFLHLAFH